MDIFAMLVCPKCKGALRREKKALSCGKCRLRYRILDREIPDMLIEDAEKF